MSKGFLFIISGAEAVGKTTLISKIENALIINTDKKPFVFDNIHANLNYEGLKNDSIEYLKKELISKINKYKEIKGEYPKYIIFDTMTHFSREVEVYEQQNSKGFNVYTNANRAINDMFLILQNLMNGKNTSFNIILVLHTYKENNEDKIRSTKLFQGSGGYISYTNEAINIENIRSIDGDSSSRLIFIKSSNKPQVVRTNIPEYKDQNEIFVLYNDFDINAHLKKIEDYTNEIKGNEI